MRLTVRRISPIEKEGKMPTKKYIHFINSDYKPLFYLPDGGRIRITYPDGRQLDRVCRFNDSHHTVIGGDLYHICEFAERMERIGAKYEPLDYIKEPEFYPKCFIVTTEYTKGADYYLIDETETHAFAFAPKGVEKGKRYCVLEQHLTGDSFNGDPFKLRTPVKWGGSLREIRPQDWGFNMAKIKAVTQKPKKRTGPKR